MCLLTSEGPFLPKAMKSEKTESELIVMDSYSDFIPAGTSSSVMRDSFLQTVKANTTSWGELSHLTPAQDMILKKFKIEADPHFIGNAKYTVENFDQCCLRFLRARQFDMSKALILLGECNLKQFEYKAPYWAKRQPDECAYCDVEALKNFYPHAQKGFDKLNRPLIFEHTGGITILSIYFRT